MKSFMVTVHQARTEVKELSNIRPEKQCEMLARVDGERFQYFMEKHSDVDNRKWRDLAYSAMFYHAGNSGNYVEWLPVVKSKKTKTIDISNKQLALF